MMRDACAQTLWWTGATQAQRRRRVAKGEVCVLGLHRVLRDADRERASSLDAIILSEKSFAAVLEHLAARYRLLTLEEFMAGQWPRNDAPPVLLTFDDGWQDNYTTAFPALKRAGVPATIFLATDYVGSGKTFWIEQLLRVCKDAQRRGQILRQAGSDGLDQRSIVELVEQLKRMSSAQRDEVLKRLGCEVNAPANGDALMSWEQVREMAAAGISFASHTASHPLLTYEDDARVRQELVRSREALQSVLVGKVHALAYPNGDQNPRVRKLAQDAGYEAAFTTEQRWAAAGDDRMALPRMLLHDGKVTDAGGRFSAAAFEFSLTGWR